MRVATSPRGRGTQTVRPVGDLARLYNWNGPGIVPGCIRIPCDRETTPCGFFPRCSGTPEPEVTVYLNTCGTRGCGYASCDEAQTEGNPDGSPNWGLSTALQ